MVVEFDVADLCYLVESIEVVLGARFGKFEDSIVDPAGSIRVHVRQACDRGVSIVRGKIRWSKQHGW